MMYWCYKGIEVFFDVGLHEDQVKDQPGRTLFELPHGFRALFGTVDD
jgi:hypothetical protein